MANICVSVISHVNRTVDLARGKKNDSSIGQMIDEMIYDSLSHGNLIYEVSFQVEESEAKDMLNRFENEHIAVPAK